MSEAEMKECRFCHEEILAVAKKCRYCGKYLDGRSNAPGRDASTIDRMLIPVGRPVSAIAAGYLALFGIIPLVGLPFSIAAVVCGFMALKAIKKDPQLSGSFRACFGIGLGGLMIFITILTVVFVTISEFARR